MSLLTGITPPERKRDCKVGSYVAKLEKADSEILANAAVDDNWPISSLSRVLRERGIDISESPLIRHRARSCSCWKA